MLTGSIIGLFLLVVSSLGLLIKWEYRRAQRSSPPLSKALRLRMESRNEPGNSYAAPPERTTRAFQDRMAPR